MENSLGPKSPSLQEGWISHPISVDVYISGLLFHLFYVIGFMFGRDPDYEKWGSQLAQAGLKLVM